MPTLSNSRLRALATLILLLLVMVLLGELTDIVEQILHSLGESSFRGRGD